MRKPGQDVRVEGGDAGGGFNLHDSVDNGSLSLSFLALRDRLVYSLCDMHDLVMLTIFS